MTDKSNKTSLDGSIYLPLDDLDFSKSVPYTDEVYLIRTKEGWKISSKQQKESKN